MANLAERLQDLANFRTFLSAARLSGVIEILLSPGPYTVFAPTDKAFTAWSDTQVIDLMRDTEKLGQILQLHIVSGSHHTDAFTEPLESLQGARIPITATTYGSASISESNKPCDNGMLHIVDQVLNLESS